MGGRVLRQAVFRWTKKGGRGGGENRKFSLYNLFTLPFGVGMGVLWICFTWKLWGLVRGKRMGETGRQCCWLRLCSGNFFHLLSSFLFPPLRLIVFICGISSAYILYKTGR